MASLKSWFSICRWSLIISNILLIIISVWPLIFIRSIEKSMESSLSSTKITELTIINASVMLCLCTFGLCSVCCYCFYPTFLYAILMTIYLLIQLIHLHQGNIGLYMTMLGVIACSFTFCAVLKRLEHDDEYVWLMTKWQNDKTDDILNNNRIDNQLIIVNSKLLIAKKLIRLLNFTPSFFHYFLFYFKN